MFVDDFWGNRGQLVCLYLLHTRKEIWQRSLIFCLLTRQKNLSNSTVNTLPKQFQKQRFSKNRF